MTRRLLPPRSIRRGLPPPVWPAGSAGRYGERIPLLLVAAAVCLATAGCMGSWMIRGTRLSLNSSYGHTTSQELLLNLVRMRYGETPTFMDLNSILSQSEASMNGISGQTGPLSGNLLGTFKLRDAPTLSYAPRTGDDLADSVIKAVDAERLLDIASGSDTRIFLLTLVDSINGIRNAPTAASPGSRVLMPNDEYREMIDLFTAIHARGAVRLRIAEMTEETHAAVPVKRPNGSEALNAAKRDQFFETVGDVTAVRERREFVVMTIRPNEVDAPDVQELCRMLGLVPGRPAYQVSSLTSNVLDYDAATAAPQQPLFDPLSMPADGDWSGDPADPPLPADAIVMDEAGSPTAPPEPTDVVSIDVRSPYHAMAFLSKGIDVPAAHLRRGVACGFTSPDGRPFDGRRLTRGLFHVCVQKHRPLHCDLAVHYRGYWFYIPESDVQSRSTLSFIRLATQIQSKSGSLPEAYALPLQ